MPRPACALPDSVAPNSYDLFIEPNMQEQRFYCEETAELTVWEPTTSITLHAKNIAIHRAVIRVGERELLTYISYQEKEGRVIFSVGETLVPGPVTLHIWCTGKINSASDLCGIYESTYTLPNGEKRTMLATQCEPTDARRIFPCFDEPFQKATIRLHLRIPSHLTAYANMTVEHETVLPNEMKDVIFQETPPMSTYLFALAVGEFADPVETRVCNGRVRVPIITTPGKAHLCAYALARTAAVLEFYEKYFGYPFPLSQYASLAVPDFGAGAMENWGFHTFRETALLIDEKNSSAAARERVREVINHECGHDWHGDLVTMMWWDGIWLNESFASFMELIAARNLNPETAPDDQFVAGDYMEALRADALATTRPLHCVVDSEDMIPQVFDSIAYCKGASLLRMMEQHLCPDVYRSGVQQYIRRHAFGCVEPKDLWAALDKTSGQPVITFMRSWVYEPGYPLVTVERVSENGVLSLRLSQKRFLAERNDAAPSPLWAVPVRITGVASDTTYPPLEKNVMLDTQELTVPVPAMHQPIVNAGRFGFFRTHYEPDVLLEFRGAIREKKLSISDRIGLCEDVGALTRAGYYSADVLLDFLSAYKNEDALRVWQVVLAYAGAVERLTIGQPHAHLFPRFMRELVSSAAQKLGWEERTEETDHEKMLRGLLLSACGKAGDQQTIREAKRRFAEFVKDRQSLVPNLRGAVYEIVASCGDGNTYAALLALYRESSLQEEQVRILRALCAFQDPALFDRTLKLMLSNDIRPQDVYPMMGAAGANTGFAECVWQYLKEHWNDFRKMFEGGKLMGRLISGVCPRLQTSADEDDVRRFFEEHPVPDATLVIAQSLERIRINAKWYARDHDAIGAWLQTNHGGIRSIT